LIANWNVKPPLIDGAIIKVPIIVNVWTLISSISPVNVTAIPDGMMIEQFPNGICPLAHVVETLNAPD
jgi:hypothetical protein